MNKYNIMDVTKTMMTLKDLQSRSNENLLNALTQVPMENVITAIKAIDINDLLEMVTDNKLITVIEGLQIITPYQIVNIPAEKLKVILKTGKPETIFKLQNYFGSQKIVEIVNRMTTSQLKNQLQTNDYLAIANYIKEFVLN